MDKSDLFVLTSNFEGMPVVIMEALAKGLGIVCTNVSGVEDLVKDDLSNSILKLYKTGNVKEAIRLIEEMSKTQIKKRKLDARKLAEKYYSIESCVDQYNIAITKVDFVPQKIGIITLKIMLIFEMVISLFISNFRYYKFQIRYK